MIMKKILQFFQVYGILLVFPVVIGLHFVLDSLGLLWIEIIGLMISTFAAGIFSFFYYKRVGIFPNPLALIFFLIWPAIIVMGFMRLYVVIGDKLESRFS
jgi:phosphotransferase system  glucose/maltose/N-acetylglucosamine-specific IIC component